MHIDQVGIWPTVRAVRATQSGAPTPLQVRRLGSARLHVRRGGLSVTDVPLDITSVEFGDSVQHWLDQGRVSSSSPRLRTDDDGRLRLHGLPRGEYAWSVVGADGNSTTGNFTVLPKQVLDVDLDLP